MQHIQNKRDNHKLLFLFLFLFLYLVLFLLGAETSHKIKDKIRSTQVIRQREIRGKKFKKNQGTVEGREHLSASAGGVIDARDNLKLTLGVRGHTPTISKRATSSHFPPPPTIPPRTSLPE